MNWKKQQKTKLVCQTDAGYVDRYLTIVGATAGKEKETDILSEIETIKLSEAEKIKTEREKIVGKMQKVLDTTEEAFKVASKNIPTGKTSSRGKEPGAMDTTEGSWLI